MSGCVWLSCAHTLLTLTALCGEDLSHAEGLKSSARIHSQVFARPAVDKRSHLEVKAGQTDGVIVFLFALSFLQEYSKKTLVTFEKKKCPRYRNRCTFIQKNCPKNWICMVILCFSLFRSIVIESWSSDLQIRWRLWSKLWWCCIVNSPEWSPMEFLVWEMWRSCLSEAEVFRIQDKWMKERSLMCYFTAFSGS